MTGLFSHCRLDRGMKDISIPRDWKSAAQVILEQTGIVMAMGLPDSGKSTLSRYLVHHLTQANRVVAMIDCDVGQNHLGPPTTMGMAIYRRPCKQFDTIKPRYMRFIGATSPVGHIMEIVVATRKLTDKALGLGAEVVIVNTGGLILGALGAKLKLNQVDLVCPKYILALRESSEIEHLLIPLEKQRVSIIRLTVSQKAQKRTHEVRRRFREQRYRKYFRQSRVIRIPLSRVAMRGHVWDEGRDATIGEEKNLLLGLCDSENYALALGILQKFNSKDHYLHILTPLSSHNLEKVRIVHLGDIRVYPTGQEEYIRGQN